MYLTTVSLGNAPTLLPFHDPTPHINTTKTRTKPTTLTSTIGSGKHPGTVHLVSTLGFPRPPKICQSRRQLGDDDTDLQLRNGISLDVAKLFHDVRARVTGGSEERRDLTKSVKRGVYYLLSGRSLVVHSVAVSFSLVIDTKTIFLTPAADKDIQKLVDVERGPFPSV